MHIRNKVIVNCLLIEMIDGWTATKLPQCLGCLKWNSANSGWFASAAPSVGKSRPKRCRSAITISLMCLGLDGAQVGDIIYVIMGSNA